MIEKLANLWDTKRWLFWLLFPVAIIAIGIKFYLDYLESKSVIDMKETSEKANILHGQQEQANKAANEAIKEAADIEKKIEDRKAEDVDVDWHLKDK